MFGIPKERILITKKVDIKLENNHTHINNDLEDINTSLYYSDDYFDTNTELVSGGNMFFINEKFIFVAKKTTKGIELLISKSYIINYSFKSVKFYSTFIKHNSKFTILDTSDTTIFLSVLNEGSNYFANIYKSNINGDEFIKSLSYNVKSPDGSFDFEKVYNNIIFIVICIA